MTYVDWQIRTIKLSTRSCDYGCPCEFNAPPTRTPCQGFEASQIVEGYFGDIRLDGLRFGATFRWPGPLHEGGGIQFDYSNRYAFLIDETYGPQGIVEH